MPESREETLYVIEQSSRAISEGRLESGLLWLINGLKRNPGEEELIRKLLEVVLEEVGQPTEERIDQLTWLSTYLRNHSAHVDTRNLDLILNSIEMVDRQIEEIHSGDSEKTLAQENPLNGEASQYLKTFSKNMKNKSVKECVLPSEETLDVELKQLERTLTLLDNDQDSSEVKLINDLTAWNYRIQSCLSVRDLTNKAEKMLEELRSTGIENNSDLVIYNIQNIDRLISQASSYSIYLDELWRSKIQQLIVSLKQFEHVRVESIVNAKIQTIRKRLKEAIPNMAGNAPYSRAIQNVNDIHVDLLKWKSSHPESIALEQITTIEKEIAEELTTLSIKRSTEYNKWAIRVIKEALKNRDADDSKVNIVNILDEKLGSIDIHILTNEISRMYNEIFEFLFSKLNAPKKADDFEDSKGKLLALEKMFNRKKKSLSDF